MRRFSTFLASTLLLVCSASLYSTDTEQSKNTLSTECQTEQEKSCMAPKLQAPLPPKWITGFSVPIEDEQGEQKGALEYSLATGTVTVTGDDKKSQADISYFAYFARPSSQESAPRPVVFCFNGGPGSSSVWLHFSGLGPKRINIPDPQDPLAQPGVVDNPYNLLQKADLIFIDPATTGWSRVREGSEPKAFHGIDEDIGYLAQCIEKLVAQFQLWETPKFLIGESYGALRVAGLSSLLLEKYFINCQGVVLLSGALDFKEFESTDLSDYSAIAPFPTYTATAHYYQRLSPENNARPLADLLQEAERFAVHEYAPALLLGDTLPDSKRQEIIEAIHRYTGLPVSTIIENNLRIDPFVFAQALFKEQGLVLGRFDTRYHSYRVAGISREWIDSSLYGIAPLFTSAINSYLEKTLGPREDSSSYIVLSKEVHPWNWGRKGDVPGGGFSSATMDLRTALTKNPAMQIFVTSGLYDLATPYFGQALSMYRLLLPKALQKNILIKKYIGGHMMYTNPHSRKKLIGDLSSFIEHAVRTTYIPCIMPCM